MGTTLKHILRINDTEAQLASGATKLKNKQIGLALDTKKFCHMAADGSFHKCPNEGEGRIQIGSTFSLYEAGGKLRIDVTSDGGVTWTSTGIYLIGSDD